MRIDGKKGVCLACTEKIARESGTPHLVITISKLERCEAKELCSCGKTFDSEESISACAKILKMIRE
jgi:hypothetical protein